MIRRLFQRPLLAPAIGFSVCMVSGLASAQPVPGGSLDPTTIPKYVDPLIVPPMMPPSGQIPNGEGEITYAGTDGIPPKAVPINQIVDGADTLVATIEP